MNEAFRQALRHGATCPPAEQLIAVMEEGAAGDRAGFGEHLESCPACQAELAMFREFTAGDIQNDERQDVDFIVKRLQNARPWQQSRPEPRESGFRTLKSFLTPAWIGSAAVAMAAILMVAGLTSHGRLMREVAPASDDGAMRSLSVKIKSPVGEVNDIPRQIEWEPVAGAKDYSVTLTEVDRTIIFHKTITSPRLLLPEETRILVTPGKTVFVEVGARDQAGDPLASSGKMSFHVVVNPGNSAR